MFTVWSAQGARERAVRTADGLRQNVSAGRPVGVRAPGDAVASWHGQPGLACFLLCSAAMNRKACQHFFLRAHARDAGVQPFTAWPLRLCHSWRRVGGALGGKAGRPAIRSRRRQQTRTPRASFGGAARWTARSDTARPRKGRAQDFDQGASIDTISWRLVIADVTSRRLSEEKTALSDFDVAVRIAAEAPSTLPRGGVEKASLSRDPP